MEIKLKFFKGKKNSIISKVSGVEFGMGEKTWIIFPDKYCLIQPKEDKVYLCKIQRHPIRDGIAFASIIKEVESTFHATSISQEGIVSLYSDYYPEEVKWIDAKRCFELDDDGLIKVIFNYASISKEWWVGEGDNLFSEVPEELKEKYMKLKEEKIKEIDKKQTRVNIRLQEMENKIVKTPLEVREVKLTLKEVKIECLYDDEDWGRRAATYTPISVRVTSIRALIYSDVFDTFGESLYNLSEGLEEESYILHTDKLCPLHEEYYEGIERFNQRGYKEIQHLSEEVLDYIKDKYSETFHGHLPDYSDWEEIRYGTKESFK